MADSERQTGLSEQAVIILDGININKSKARMKGRACMLMYVH